MYKKIAPSRRRLSALLAVLFALLLMTTLAACGGPAEDQASQGEPATAPAEDAAAAEPTQQTIEEPTAAPEEEPTAAPEEESAGESLPTSMEHAPDPMLVNVTWEWISREPNGNDVDEITVDMPENYTLFFNEDGTFAAQVDCNNVLGSYATSNVEDEYRSIFMEAGASTMAFCGEDSLDQAMAQMFGPAQNYVFENDGNMLVFSWVAAGPIDTYQKAAAADEETAAPADEDLNSTLANMTYTSEFTQDGTATLVDGTYEEAAAPGSATMTTVTLLPEYTATGELNGEPAAAVILATDPGGSGTFVDLAVVTEVDGEPTNVAVTGLGDRVQINSVTIENNQIVVDMLTQGPDDPMCCPSQQVEQTYELQADQLVLVDSTEGSAAPEADADTPPSADELQNTLANMTYTSEFTQDGTATLVDGTYEEAAAPGSATMTTVTLLPEYTATGELNGEPAAAVILATDPGGSGTFVDLAVVTEVDGEPTNVAVTGLGDRVQINSVTIENDQIVVDMVTPGPDDPMCCPTLQVVQTYELQDGKLTLVNTTEIGPLAEEAPAAQEPAVDADDPDPVAEDAPEIDLPDAEANEPSGVVTAPAGVNVRTGPGTEYAIIGMASQGAEGEIVGKSEDGQWWVAVAPDAPNEYGWVSAAYVDATNADNVPVIPSPPSPQTLAFADAELSDGAGYNVPADVLIFSASRRLLEGNRAYELEDVYVAPAKPGSESVLAANNAMQPALSPDGRTLAFRSMQSDKFGLGGYDLDTAQRLRFSRFNEDSNPRWSPSGDRMVYASNKEGDRAWRIYITEAVAKENPADMTYSELGPGLDPDWHPTEELIVFKGCNLQGQECGLYTIGTDGSNRTQLTNVADDSRPRWLPNGSGIVFMSKERDGNWELYRANADGSEVVRLTKFAAPDGLPAVSPDGSRIAFLSKRDNQWGVWVMPAAGGVAKLVTSIADEQPDWLVHGIDWTK